MAEPRYKAPQGCGPELWAEGKKCCPDCSHSRSNRRPCDGCGHPAEPFRFWPGMLAIQAREQGFPVPAEIPDVAMLTYEDVKYEALAAGDGSPFGLSMSMTPSWSWCTIEGTVSPAPGETSVPLDEEA